MRGILTNMAGITLMSVMLLGTSWWLVTPVPASTSFEHTLEYRGVSQ